MWRYQWFHCYRVCLLIVLKFVGVSSKHLRVFLKSFRQSSEIFGNFWKFSENVRERSSGLRNNFRKSSESGQKSSENHQKAVITDFYIIKRTLHVSSKIWILCSRGKNNISLMRYCSCHSNIKFIYYIKVSGIASSNKLIKTIRDLHMWRYRWFQLESLRQFSEIFGHLRKFSRILGKCSGTFRLTFGTILKGLWKSSESGGKSSEKSSKTPSSVCLCNKKNFTR